MKRLIKLVHLLSLFVLITLSVNSVDIKIASASLTDGLVAHYTFDDNTNDSAGSNNGAASGGPIYVEGKVGKAMQFDGTDDYVNVPFNSILNWAGKSITVSFWIKSTQSGVNQYILQTQNGGTPGSGWFIYLTAENFLYAQHRASTNLINVGTGVPIPQNTWKLVTLTLDGSIARLYVDGTYNNQDTYADLVDNDNQLSIGRYRGIGGYIMGSLDDVRMYSRALEASEIQDLYNYTGDSSLPPGNPDITVVSDTTAPIISNLSPTGTLSAGTNSTTLSVITNENATCKYSTSPNTSYDSQTLTFGTTGGSNHQTTISNLQNGQNYNYYIRCSDTANNKTVVDTTISFSVRNPVQNLPSQDNPTVIPPSYNPLSTTGLSCTLNSNSLNIEDLGTILRSNTQEKQIMFRDVQNNDLHLILYYVTTNLSTPTQLLDVNFSKGTTNLIDIAPGRPGPNATAYNKTNNKLYIGTSAGDPSYLVEYDPVAGTSRRVSTLHYRGAQYIEIGDDGWVYIGEYNSVGGGAVERYNPSTNVFQDLGIMDSVRDVGQTSFQWAYTVGADSRYVYVGLGELPWYLAIYDTQTQTKTLHWKSDKDTGGAVWHGRDGNWYYTRILQGETEYKWYKLIDGAPVSISPKNAGVDMFSYNNESGNTVRGYPSLWKLRFNIDVDIRDIYPDSGNGNRVIVKWRDVSASDWQSISATGFNLSPINIKRIYPLNNNTLFGFADFYGPVFTYDSSRKEITTLGRPSRSIYDALFDGRDIYLSGYAAVTLRYDSTRPWTLKIPTGSSDSISDTKNNPYQIPLSIGKYQYYSAKGSDGLIYIGSHHERDSVGGELGWYNSTSGAKGSLRAPFLDYDVNDLKPVLNGKKLVYVSNRDKLFIFDIATKQIEKTIIPIPSDTTQKVVEVEPGIVFGITNTKFYKVNVTTGEIIYTKEFVGGRSFSGIPGADVRLEKGPDGYVWLFIGNNLSRINPVDGSIGTIMSNLTVSNLMFNGSDIYFYGGSNLKRIKNAFTCSGNLQPTLPQNALCSTRLNRCTTGTVSGRTSNTTHNLWTCNGLNGGSNASCSILKTAQDPVNPIVPVDPLPTPPLPITNPLTPAYTPAYTPVHTPTPYTYKKPVATAPKVISPTPDLPPSPSFEPLDFIPTDYIQILLDLIKQFSIDLMERIKRGAQRIMG